MVAFVIEVWLGLSALAVAGVVLAAVVDTLRLRASVRADKTVGAGAPLTGSL